MATLDLFREMDSLRKEIDHIFSDMSRGRLLEPGFLPGLDRGHYPQVNISEDEKNFYVQALVPGIDPAGLELSLMKRVLTISGERKSASEGKPTWHRRERGAGRFMRTIDLPEGVESKHIDANCHNGVLTMTLAKAEAAVMKKIDVKAK